MLLSVLSLSRVGRVTMAYYSARVTNFYDAYSLSLTANAGYSTTPQVTGFAYAANDAAPTPPKMTTAVGDMEAAYTDAAGRPTPDYTNLHDGDIGGMTLKAGLYKWTGSVGVNSDVTLEGSDTSDTDTWIFQMTGNLVVAGAKKVLLAGGAKAENIVWQVAGFVQVGEGAHMEGILLVKTAATFVTGSSLNGRILSQTAVVLQVATITQPN